METSEATLAGERCAVHPDRVAVGLCERCGRTACLECAIPFRGDIRCERCAALELGDPAPVPEERARRIRAEHIQLAFLLVGIAATYPPWHRSGTLTTRLSAWSFGLDGWAALSCVALAAGLLLVLLGLSRRSSAPRAVAASTILSASAAIATWITLARAPAFFSATAAPFLGLGATALATLLGAFRVLKWPRP